MIEISLKELIDIVEGEVLFGSLETNFKGYSIDTRNIHDSCLFIPIIGDRFNGNDYIDEAFTLGASVSLISDLSKRPLEISEEKTLIFVKDSLVALQRIAAYLLMKADIPVIAITGSTGKTTTKEMIASILEESYCVLKNVGNFNNHIGLPLTLLRLTEDHEIAVLEMGMSDFNEIKRLAAITQPQISVITNIGESHIEKLGSQEGILKAKMEITSFMKKEDLLIVNGDDKLLNDTSKITKYKKFLAGENSKCDVVLKSYELGKDGSKFKVQYDGKIIDFSLSVPGYHSITNSLLAISVGLQLDLPLEDITNGLLNYKSGDMRLNVYDVGEEIRIIDDVYNASPDSMIAALKVMSSYDGWKKVAVLGDMLEMGEFSKNAHERVGIAAVENGANAVLLIGEKMEYAETAIRGLDNKNVKVIYSKDKEILHNQLIKEIEPKTIFLFKGSRSMKMEYFVEKLKESIENNGYN